MENHSALPQLRTIMSNDFHINSDKFLSDRIKVYALFDFGHSNFKPLKFKWQNRIYKIEEITYKWKSTKGSTEFIHFSARDNSDLFELVFNTNTFEWEIQGTESLAN